MTTNNSLTKVSNAMTPEELRKVRTKFNFDVKYKAEYGGVEKLMEFVDGNAKLSEITAHFPLTNSRMSQILEVLLDMPYSVFLARAGVKRKKVPHDS